MKSIKKLLQASLILAAVFGATQSSAMYSSKAQIEHCQRAINKLQTERENIRQELDNTNDKQEQALLMKKLSIVNNQLEIKGKEIAGLKGYL